MFLAATALLLQFSAFTPHQIRPVQAVSQQAVVKGADPSTASHIEDSTPSKGEVLTAQALSANAAASVAFAPGRLMPEPVAAAGSAAADPVSTPIPGPAAPIVAQPVSFVPVYGPAYRPPIKAVSDRRQNREWLALSVAAHTAAGFDAWSTRRVLTSVPNAREMNPLLRPFAGNASMYAAVQVTPTILDFVSRRMMNSRHEWARHMWWLPQAVSAVVSVSSGVHNMGVYNSR